MSYPQQPEQPWGQDPYGQQEQWAPAPDAWSGGGGGDYGPPPPVKRGGAGKTVAIVVVVLLLVGGAGVGLYFWLKRDSGGSGGGGGPAQGADGNDPKAVATAWANVYVQGYNSDWTTVRVDKVKPLTCQSHQQDLDREQQKSDAEHQHTSSGAVPLPSHPTYSLQVGDVQVTGDKATVQITATVTGRTGATQGASTAPGNGKSKSTPFLMAKEATGWKVCGPQGTGGGSGTTTGGAPVPTSGGAQPTQSSQPQPSSSGQSLPSGIPLPTSR